MATALDPASALSASLSTFQNLVTGVDSLWLVVAIGLVYTMQGGFLMLEAGSVRSKNAISVTQKNVADFAISALVFLGGSSLVAFGTSLFQLQTSFDSLSLLYQMAFCAAALTIVSGAVAERIRFSVYVLMTLVGAALIYPVFASWVWPDALVEGRSGWLADLGFIDHAGGAVVHLLGASIALACVLVIGPRRGRYDGRGQLQPLQGHSSVLAMGGVFTLWVGWLGFNAGTTSPFDPMFGTLIVNTVLGGIAGAIAGMTCGVFSDKGRIKPYAIMVGLLSGLVSVTSGTAVLGVGGALILGAIGGGASVWVANIMARNLKIDDPVDAIATHGVGGLVGLLGLALLAPASSLSAGSALGQLGIQFVGALACIAWAMGTSFLAIKLIGHFMPLRVSPEEERVGLNVSEHDTALGTDSIRRALAGNDTVTTLGAATDEGSELLSAIQRIIANHDRARFEIEEDKKRFRDFAEAASDMLWEIDRDFRFTFASERLLSLTGAHGNDLLGKPVLSVFRMRDEESASFLSQLEQHKTVRDFVVRMRDADAQDHVMQINITPHYDRAGRLAGYRGAANDVTAKIKAEGRVKFLAHHDPLTGLANRAAFSRALVEAVTRNSRSGQRFAVCVMDLTGFKGVNDSYGHAAGDEVLKVIAERLKSIAREHDTLARLGGDEFAIILNGVEDSAAAITGWAQRALALVSRRIQFGELQLDVQGCAGFALYPEHALATDSLLNCADMALYRAKEEGPGQYSVFSDDLREMALERRELERELRIALEDNLLTVAYQPQVDAQSEQLIGFEALVRWTHPRLGEISPARFIPVAEQCGLMEKLGSFVLHEACKAAASWPTVEAFPLKIAVNVSPVQFFRQDLARLVETALSLTGLAPARLEIEITESMLMRDAKRSARILREISALGVSIAIDDFGTGYSSLSYLKRFPLNKLKIDRSFVNDIEHDASDQQIGKAIVGLGRSLGLSIVAEGVETIGQRNILAGYGCNSLQGFLYAKAMPSDTITPFILKQMHARMSHFAETPSADAGSSSGPCEPSDTAQQSPLKYNKGQS